MLLLEGVFFFSSNYLLLSPRKLVEVDYKSTSGLCLSRRRETMEKIQRACDWKCHVKGQKLFIYTINKSHMKTWGLGQNNVRL